MHTTTLNRLPQDSGEWRRVTPRDTNAPARSFGKRLSVYVPYASPLVGSPEQIPPGCLRVQRRRARARQWKRPVRMGVRP